MELKRMPQELSVCKLYDDADVPPHSGLAEGEDLCFVGRTDEEVSLVCPTSVVPERTIEREDGWRAFRIQGVLDFSLIGILSKISGILADEGIGIFAVSTYNTDYILVKEENFDRGLRALSDAGYDVV